MSAGLEAMTVQEWIVARLSEDAQLQAAAGGVAELEDRIWDGEYKGSAETVDGFWWISFTCSDTVDVKGVGMIQVMGRVRYSAKVVVCGESYAPGVPIYKRVHELLDGQLNDPTSEGIVLTSERVSGFQFPERTTGMEYRHLGGQYEALSQ